jgi:PAS domain S-box-containing protein
MKQESGQSIPQDEQFHAQNQLLKDALDALAYPFCIINAENYTIELANSAAFGGQLHDEIACYRLLHGREVPCAKGEHPCPLEKVKETKQPVVMEHLHLNEDGEFQNVEVHSYPILDAGGNISHIIEYTQDITERKQFEESLRESESKWRSLIENSPDHILMLDRDLKIQLVNFPSPGLTVEELIGKPLYNYVNEGGDEVKAILESVLRTGTPAQYETIYHSPDGRDIYYETYVTARRLAVSNEITGLTLGSRDITKRVQIDAEKQALTHALGERVKELSCLYNISKLIMTPEITLDEILQGAVKLIPPSLQYPETTCARVILEDLNFKTGNYRDSPWTLTADIYVQGKVSGMVEVGYLEEKPEIDDGPFLKEEQDLLNAIAESLGSTVERFRSKERIHQNELQLAALKERERIGRELHDDLGQVIGYIRTQTMTARIRLDQGQYQEAQAILDQLIHTAKNAYNEVRQYILGIRKSSRIPGDRTPGFHTILEDYLETLHDRYGLKTRVSMPKDWLDNSLAPEVETQLLRIIQEALTNVGKHAGVYEARLLFTQHEDDLQVVVSDEGSGFQEMHPGSEPTGEDERQFGLEIIRERAEAVGGHVEVRSAPGQGTTIIVRIPRTLSQAKTAIGDSIRVLLVDDHPLYLDGLQSLLASRGFQVVGVAHDGLQAQSLALSLRPDLILMDINMPYCDGLEATKHIKKELPETKIVMLTVEAEADTLFTALKYGASGYLLKSLEGRQFFDLLANVLNGETILSPEMATMVLNEFSHRGTESSSKTEKSVALTGRQNEVLELTARGLTNKEIAGKLHLTEATVKYHVSNILERLHLQSRYQLTDYARQQGNSSPSGGE